MLGPVGIADRCHVDVAPGVVEANAGFRIVAVQRADDAAFELAERPLSSGRRRRVEPLQMQG